MNLIYPIGTYYIVIMLHINMHILFHDIIIIVHYY
jgi:hypothetical protein